jgi:hypothetical protein
VRKVVDGQARVIGTMTLDMAGILSVEERSAPSQQFQMETRHGVSQAGVQVDMGWSFVKQGKPTDDDVASNLSAMDELEDDSHYQDDEDDDDDEGEVDGSAFTTMTFSVFMQEEGEDTVTVAVRPPCAAAAAAVVWGADVDGDAPEMNMRPASLAGGPELDAQRSARGAVRRDGRPGSVGLHARWRARRPGGGGRHPRCEPERRLELRDVCYALCCLAADRRPSPNRRWPVID